jgi:hypothetical protein
MSREYCRVDDCPSYDYSAYEDSTGYYTQHDSGEEDYDPIEQPEIHKRLKEVKTRLGVKQDD